MQYSVAVGSESERISALKAQADIYIINRENVQWLIEKSGIPFDFDMVVVDELSSFKNYQSKRFKALMKARPKVKRMVGLTGTPSSNGLMDLFAEFKLLDMGARLGRFVGQYRTAYLKMPELISTQMEVKLSEPEKKKYEELKKDLILQLPDGEITAANAASLTGKLSQMANGAVYSDNESVLEIHQRKLEALEDIIESANGKPVLVAYWFRHDLERIRKRFDVREIKTAKDIADWNNGSIPVAVIHPASAGHGLNLQQGGSALVWFGITWSLELYQQTNARLWRQGQSAETVVITHIITKGTIDERIIKALKTKDISQSALIDAVKANL